MSARGTTIIIGAGIGGLAAGHYLREAGRDVQIYERAAIPGGRIQLLERDGARVDVGTQYFHTNYTESFKLLDAVGLREKLVPIRAPVMLMRNGKGFLAKHNTRRYKVVPLGSNLKFGRLILTALSNFRRLDPYFNEPLEEFENIDLAEYVLKKCDRDTLEFLVRPLITAFNLADPEGESLAHFLRIIKQFLTSSDMCLTTGMYTFPEQLAKTLPVTYNAEVQEITTQADRVTGIRVRLAGETRTIPADSVICALPLKELPGLLPALTDEERRAVGTYAYPPFPLVVFFMKRRLPERHWAYVFSRTENYHASFTSDATFKCAEMVPSGVSILQVWFVGESGPSLVDESDERLLHLARVEMRRVISQFDREVASSAIVRHHTGMSRYRVGTYPALRGLLKSMERFDGLHLVGDMHGHSTIETVVRSAQRATNRILRTA
jgi:protoporphyrinogen oxidase